MTKTPTRIPFGFHLCPDHLSGVTIWPIECVDPEDNYTIYEVVDSSIRTAYGTLEDALFILKNRYPNKFE